MLLLPSMKKSEYNIVGVMSGTSLDGIDMVWAKFYLGHSWQFKIICAETVPYPKKWQEQLAGLVRCSVAELETIDALYTKYLAGIIKAFVQKHHIKQLDAVCSHGHTALHQPEKQLTFQIGNRPELAQILKETVVCDFRVQDVALGGQGAPLVPIGDKLLFAQYHYCLNLGGFANISTERNNQRVAYDICPVNIVLNHYVRQLGFDFDDGGRIASTGTVNAQLLEQLNALRFYKESPPKSLGLEWVNQVVFPLIDSFKSETHDVLKTLVEHIAIQIASEITSKQAARVLITGGGAYHKYLIERLGTLSNQQLVIPENDLVEFKEALIFGLLGVLKLRGEVNCLQSVTGASKNHSSGQVYLP